jgi:hypothetical protein
MRRVLTSFPRVKTAHELQYMWLAYPIALRNLRGVLCDEAGLLCCSYWR